MRHGARFIVKQQPAPGRRAVLLYQLPDLSQHVLFARNSTPIQMHVPVIVFGQRRPVRTWIVPVVDMGIDHAGHYCAAFEIQQDRVRPGMGEDFLVGADGDDSVPGNSNSFRNGKILVHRQNLRVVQDDRGCSRPRLCPDGLDILYRQSCHEEQAGE